jgi:hypothetical protein
MWYIYKLVTDQRCSVTHTEIMENWNISTVIEYNEVLDFKDGV